MYHTFINKITSIVRRLEALESITSEDLPYSERIVHEKLLSGHTVTIIMEQQGDKTEVGVALCSPNDQFCRKTGRQIAYDNMGKVVHPMTTRSIQTYTRRETLNLALNESAYKDENDVSRIKNLVRVLNKD